MPSSAGKRTFCGRFRLIASSLNSIDVFALGSLCVSTYPPMIFWMSLNDLTEVTVGVIEVVL